MVQTIHCDVNRQFPLLVRCQKRVQLQLERNAAFGGCHIDATNGDCRCSRRLAETLFVNERHVILVRRNGIHARDVGEFLFAGQFDDLTGTNIPIRDFPCRPVNRRCGIRDVHAQTAHCQRQIFIGDRLIQSKDQCFETAQKACAPSGILWCVGVPDVNRRLGDRLGKIVFFHIVFCRALGNSLKILGVESAIIPLSEFPVCYVVQHFAGVCACLVLLAQPLGSTANVLGFLLIFLAPIGHEFDHVVTLNSAYCVRIIDFEDLTRIDLMQRNAFALFFVRIAHEHKNGICANQSPSLVRCKLERHAFALVPIRQILLQVDASRFIQLFAFFGLRLNEILHVLGEKAIRRVDDFLARGNVNRKRIFAAQNDFQRLVIVVVQILVEVVAL